MPAKISLMAAIGERNELGAGNDLLWHLPDDFAWFVKHTRGHAIVMGRKTMESLGKPLKNRRNLVVTRNLDWQQEGVEIFPNLESALESAQNTESDEIFIIGGGDIFSQSINLADRMYITLVGAEFPEADTFFPPFGKEWEIVFSEKHVADERHRYAFEFQIWERQNAK